MGKKILMKSGIKPNTFIGGVGATINTPALLASTLGILVSRIKAFKVVGADIEFAVVGGNYNLKRKTFYGNNNITFLNDEQGKISFIDAECFLNAKNIEYINIPGTTHMKLWQTFEGAESLKTITAINLNQLSDGGSRVWDRTYSFELLDAKKLKIIPPYHSGAQIFRGWKPGAKMKVNSFLLTSEAGGVNSNILDAKNNRGAVVEFYDDAGNYVSTL